MLRSKKLRHESQRIPNWQAHGFLKGRIYATQSSWDNAEAAVQKSIELDPNFRWRLRFAGSGLLFSREGRKVD
jgi:hypothetical protein